MTNSCEPVPTFDKRPFYLNHFELCNFKRVGNFELVQCLVLEILPYNHKDVNAKYFGYVSDQGIQSQCNAKPA